jgi:hypothetical protein
MTLEDALRKVKLLRAVRPENGAYQAEAETAAAIVERLASRFAIGAPEPRPAPDRTFRQSWVYWENLLAEHGLQLRHFGRRGSATWEDGRTVLLIRQDTDSWLLQRTSGEGWDTVAANTGLASLRDRLSKERRMSTFCQR